MNLLWIRCFSIAESLSCDWTSNTGKLNSHIIHGSSKLVSTTNAENCRLQCTEQTSFICAAVNYETSSGACELLAENDQTASPNASVSGWRYHIRPGCAGEVDSLDKFKFIRKSSLHAVYATSIFSCFLIQKIRYL